MKAGIDYIWVGVWCLILNDEGKILLTKRSSNCTNEAWFRWQPGWKVDFGETFVQAAIREIKEETNLEIQVVELLCLTDHIIPHEKQHRVTPSYLAKVVWWELKNMEPHKFDEICWFDINDLPHPLSPHTIDSTSSYLKIINKK